MPWNDLHSRLFSDGAVSFYPVLSIGPFKKGHVVRQFPCGNTKKTFFDLGISNALTALFRMWWCTYRRNSKLIIHVHNPSLFWVAFFFKIFLPRTKLVSNLHNEWAFFNNFQKISNFMLLAFSDRFICVSRSISERVPFNYLKNILSINNGIDKNFFNSNYPVNSFHQQRDNKVIVVARMVQQKDPFTVLKIFNSLPTSLSLEWYGDGPLLNQMISFTEDIGCSNRIIFKGRRDRKDVYDALFRSKFYMSGSLWEGIGVANLEACALGAVCLLSDIPPHQEISNALNLETLDFVNEPKDIVRFVVNTLNKAERLSKCERMAQANVTRDLYDFNKCVQSYISIYKAL